MATGDERVAWVLNLDADLELAVPAYTPRATVRDAMRAFVPIVARSLLGPNDVIVDEASAPGSAHGMLGRAFCPTPRAIALLERAGAEVEPHPVVDVLRRVNSRAFCASLGQTLAGAELVTDEARAFVKLAAGGPWRIKRLFGMTGRNQRVVSGEPSDVDRGFVRSGLSEGGVQIEPNVGIDAEYAIHGMLAADGRIALGSVVTQRCDSRGAWIGTEPFDGDDAVREALVREATRVAAALHAARYFGPFGIDAFTYDGGKLNPRSEINARYTMGFAIGFRGTSSR